MQSGIITAGCWRLGWVAASLLLVTVGQGCRKEPDSTRRSDAPESAQKVASGPREVFDESAFRVAMYKAGSYQAGRSAQVEVRLTAKPPFKVNDEYPIKFRLEPTAGVKFESSTVGKDRATIKGKEALMPVAFTPESAGSKQILGELKFSVCDAERCLLEKRQLTLKVDVE